MEPMDSGEPLFKVPGWAEGGAPSSEQVADSTLHDGPAPPAPGPVATKVPVRRSGKGAAIAAVAALAAVLIGGMVFMQLRRGADRPTTTVTATPGTEGAAEYTAPEPMRSASAVIVGTCDEGSSCGVKQRTAPYTAAPRLYSVDLQDGMEVIVVCQTTGDVRSSRGYGSSRTWYRIDNGAYVNAVYLNVAGERLPSCSPSS